MSSCVDLDDGSRLWEREGRRGAGLDCRMVILGIEVKRGEWNPGRKDVELFERFAWPEFWNGCTVYLQNDGRRCM